MAKRNCMGVEGKLRRREFRRALGMLKDHVVTKRTLDRYERGCRLFFLFMGLHWNTIADNLTDLDNRCMAFLEALVGRRRAQTYSGGHNMGIGASITINFEMPVTGQSPPLQSVEQEGDSSACTSVSPSPGHRFSWLLYLRVSAAQLGGHGHPRLPLRPQNGGDVELQEKGRGGCSFGGRWGGELRLKNWREDRVH